MARIVDPPNLLNIIKAQEKRIRVLESAARLTASSIRTNGNSALTVLDSSGNHLASTGDVPAVAGGTIPGFATYRASGAVGFTAVTGQLALQDQAANLVIAVNESTGYGLVTPYISFPMYPSQVALLASTAAGTDTLMWSGSAPQSHSFLDFRGQAAISGGATGSITLSVGGVTIGTISVSSAGFTTYAFNNVSTGASPAVNGLAGVNLTGKITSGAGTLSVAVFTTILHG